MRLLLLLFHFLITRTAATCAICLYALPDGAISQVRLNCGHQYHKDCLTQWVSAGGESCPLCRAPLPLSVSQRIRNHAYWIRNCMQNVNRNHAVVAAGFILFKMTLTRIFDVTGNLLKPLELDEDTESFVADALITCCSWLAGTLLILSRHQSVNAWSILRLPQIRPRLMMIVVLNIAVSGIVIVVSRRVPAGI